MGPLGRGHTGLAPISQMGTLTQLGMRRQAQKQGTAAWQPALQKVPELFAWPHPKSPSLSQRAPLGEGRDWQTYET